MQRIIYTNLSPVSNAYTNFNHIFELKKHNPQKVFICIWDSFVYEHPLFHKNIDSKKNKNEKLQENVEIIEKLLSFLEIDYKILTLSEAMSRLFKSTEHFKEFQNILSNIKVEDLTGGFGLRYIPFGDISLSRLNYIISDYLVATYLPELFPEICSSQPTHYLTSERFKVFQREINQNIRSNPTRYVPPKTLFVTNVPVIIHPEERIIPSLEMSYESVKRIVKAYYKRKPSDKEILDLSTLFFSVQDELAFKETKITKDKIDSLIGRQSYKDFIEFVSSNLFNYFNEINKIATKTPLKKQKRSVHISTYTDFSHQIKPLNDIKLQILRHCDGSNSSVDISKLTGLNLSTVATYLGHLKAKKIVDRARRPKRLIDTFVIDLGVMEK